MEDAKMSWRYAVPFALALPACAAQGSDVDSQVATEGSTAGATQASTAAVTSPDGQILADITVSTGSRVQIVEVAPGEVALSEVGAGNPDDAVLKRIARGSLLDVYSVLMEHGAAYDANVVERLTQAQLRIDTRSVTLDAAGPEVVRPAVETEVTRGAADDENVASEQQALLVNEQGPHPVFTDAEFQQVYCNAAELGFPQQACAIRTSSADTGWSHETTWIRSIVLTIAALNSTTHKMHHWRCVQKDPLFGICLRNGWKNVLTQTIPPRNYGMIISDFNLVKFTGTGTLFHLGEVGQF
jgi:hypothetical protein